MKKRVFVFLFEGFADWEIAYLTPEINKNELFELIYFSKDGNPVSSMGGLHVIPNIALSEFSAESVDLLILPGGDAWEKGKNIEIDDLTREVFELGTPIAAICAATTYLGNLGILNDLKHTSNDLDYLKELSARYSGEEKYMNSLAVTDGNLITANGVASIEFAREIFRMIRLYDEDRLEKWYRLFKKGIWKE